MLRTNWERLSDQARANVLGFPALPNTTYEEFVTALNAGLKPDEAAERIRKINATPEWQFPPGVLAPLPTSSRGVT